MKPLEMGQQLVERLLLPLMRGGEVRLVAPLGEAVAIELGSSLPGSGAFEEVEALKLRAARHLYPVDWLGDVSADEWSLLVALNDLLQLTNPALSRGFGGASRAPVLKRLVDRLVRRAGAPATVAQALSRHALFSRAVLLTRRDTTVSWWSGKQSFVGQEPASRLLAWPSFRQVKQHAALIPLAEMGQSVSNDFEALLGGWLAATPLTAFAGIAAGSVRFHWVGSTLALTASPLGRNLALRSLMSAHDVPDTLARLQLAARELEATHAAAARHARDFVDEAARRHRQLSA